jgi:hypothetical protein
MWTYASIAAPVKLGLLILAILLVAWFSPRRFAPARALRRGFRRLANRPWLVCGLLAGLTVAVNFLLAAIRFPVPWTHDELAYVLASDTFAHGRLTNPPHPMWEHFETFHVLSQPTYMAKYPPASGLFMGLGQWMTGYPIAGVWIAYALSVAAMYWMLRAWTSPQWAALGGILVACHAPMIQAWGQSYWGGSVALLGGALVYGGLRRICKTARWGDAVLLAVGMVLLANSRPMEGLLVSLPAAGILAVWYVRSPTVSLARKTWHVALPMVVIGGGALVAMGAWNRAVTGDVWTMPYQLHDRTYSASSLIVWRPLPPVPEYRHPRMERFYREWGRDRQRAWQTDPLDFARNLGRKLLLLWDFLPIGTGLVLIAGGALLRKTWYRLAIGVCGLILLVHTQLATSWMYPHYVAPAFALFLAVNIQCLRQIRVWQRGHRRGLAIVRVVILLAMLKLVPLVASWPARGKLHPVQFVQQQLAAESGRKHLVIVSYGDDYRIVDDWVYNAADIDAAPLVFARDMGPEKNEQLVEYFRDRKVWRWHLESDEQMSFEPLETAGDPAVAWPKLSTVHPQQVPDP